MLTLHNKFYYFWLSLISMFPQFEILERAKRSACIETQMELLTIGSIELSIKM